MARVNKILTCPCKNQSLLHCFGVPVSQFSYPGGKVSGGFPKIYPKMPAIEYCSPNIPVTSNMSASGYPYVIRE